MDSIVKSIINKFTERSKFGKEKYGTDLDRDDLSVLEWLTHFQEELMDGILYAEKLKQVLLEKDLLNKEYKHHFEKSTPNSKKDSTSKAT
jgi:hypothetical protein